VRAGALHLLKSQAPDTSFLPLRSEACRSGGFYLHHPHPGIYAAEHTWTDNSGVATDGFRTAHSPVSNRSDGGGGQRAETIKLAVDSLTLPTILRCPKQPGKILRRTCFSAWTIRARFWAFSLRTKDKASRPRPDDGGGLATFLTRSPRRSCCVLRPTCEAGRPPGRPEDYTMLGKKTMDVDTQLNYLSFQLRHRQTSAST